MAIGVVRVMVIRPQLSDVRDLNRVAIGGGNSVANGMIWRRLGGERMTLGRRVGALKGWQWERKQGWQIGGDWADSRADDLPQSLSLSLDWAACWRS